jgi:DNA primase
VIRTDKAGQQNNLIAIRAALQYGVGRYIIFSTNSSPFYYICIHQVHTGRMKVSEQKIEEIRTAANIVDVVGDYVQLRKRGNNYIGLCPFHNEKTPSFTVNEDKQIFYCFGCHTGGNAFKFIMEYEKVSFPEALQKLADKFGVTIQYEKTYDAAKDSYQEMLYEINNIVARYYSENLLTRPEGEPARNYFDKRKLKGQTLRSFGLGYALPSRDSLYQYLHKKNTDLEKAVHLGLLGKNNEGRYYDKFAGRIIFPIFSAYGRVIAFAGRILEPSDNQAKYLNSPESSIYIKGRTLYGLSAAKDDLRKLDFAIIVEGYMDLISLHQAGVKNVVAVSGTALTDDQVQLLSRYTKNVILLFDADTAGVKASMRSIEILLKKDIDIKIVSLPQGEDPDSFLNNYGKEKFEEEISRAKHFFEFQSSVYEARGMFNDPAQTAEAIRELVRPLSMINDELKRTLLMRDISKKFNLREILLEKELQKALEAVKKTERSYENRAAGSEKEGIQLVEKTRNSKLLNTETEIIALMFEGSGNIINYLMEHIEPEEFEEPSHVKIASTVFDTYRNGEDIIASALLPKFEEEDIQQYIAHITMEKYHLSRNWEKIDPTHSEIKNLSKIAQDLVKRFKIIHIGEKITRNHNKIASAQSESEQIALMAENKELQKLISQL